MRGIGKFLCVLLVLVTISTLFIQQAFAAEIDPMPTVTETVSAKTYSMSAKQTTTGRINRSAKKIPAPHKHKYVQQTSKRASCLNSGKTEYTCSCGRAFTKGIPQKQHTYIRKTISATCTRDGYRLYTCSQCNTSRKTKYKEATGHCWTDWEITQKPTFTSTGTKTRSCSGCKKQQTAVVEKLAHTHSFTETVMSNATCTEAGTKKFTCICGESYTENIPASGHSWSSWITVVDPTETTEGIAEKTCSSCNTTKTKTLDKLPHTHFYTKTEVAASCTEDGYTKIECSCGYELIKTLPASHQWKDYHEDEIGHWDVYIVCHCGWRCSADGNYIIAFANHVDSIDIETRYDHSYYDVGEWIVDIPAKDWTECVECGAIQ